MPDLDIEAFSSGLDWKEFEAFAKFAFESFGYKVTKNFRLKNPRTEIDLLAFREGKCFAADCKHWKRSVGRGSMQIVADKQVERAKRLMKKCEFEELFPLIITLREESIQVLENGVPLVPVRKLSDFLLNFDEYSKTLNFRRLA